jgi:hypothetical protein
MAIRSRGIVVAALAATTLGLAALAGCAVSRASGGGAEPSGPTASTPATGGTATAAASPTAPAPRGGPGTPTPAGDSGITGVTVVDAGCPVLRADSPCPDRPFQAHLTVTDTGSGALVATAETDPAGHFRIPLPPGQYLIQGANPNGAPLPRAAPTTTTVASGRYTTLTIRFDSGIR